MNRLPIATALISITAAVGLWLIAMWLEGGAPWQAPQSGADTGIASSGVRPDTDVQQEEDVAGCDVAEGSLREKVGNSQYCSTDDDCTLFDYGYPIECLTSVSKSEITALRQEYWNYEQSCPYRVYYDCPTGQMERQAVCRNSRCSVELKSNELLEEKTLEYLGIDPRR